MPGHGFRRGGQRGYLLTGEEKYLVPYDSGQLAASASATRVRSLLEAQGVARSEDRSRALLAGYQVHVSKPIEPSELLAVVGSLARRRPRPRITSHGT